MKTVTIQHVLNETARHRMAGKTFNELMCDPSENLKQWLSEISLRDGYFTSWGRDSENVINAAREYIADAFSMEMHVNKIHLQDDYKDGLDVVRYIGIYFYICNFIQYYVMSNEAPSSVILWYSTDAYNEDEEFPSHTVSFAMERARHNRYPLDSDNYRNVFHIGTRISSM
ncbi:MAG TPA: hypothetical protein VK181_00920 [Rhizobium sp.]|nr:hypothetical protein [Rhizobium sp.]